MGCMQRLSAHRECNVPLLLSHGVWGLGIHADRLCAKRACNVPFLLSHGMWGLGMHAEAKCPRGVKCPNAHTADEWRLSAAIRLGAKSFRLRSRYLYQQQYCMQETYKTEYCDYVLSGTVCKHGKSLRQPFLVRTACWALSVPQLHCGSGDVQKVC